MQNVQANLLEGHVNLDDIIEYTVNTHLVHEVSNDVDITDQPDMLVAHMSGQWTSPNGTLPGDIRHVLAAKRGTRKSSRLRSMRHPPIRLLLRLEIVPTSLIKAKP
jgi:hypothetical protein